MFVPFRTQCIKRGKLGVLKRDKDFDVVYIGIYTPEFGNTHHSMGLHLGLGYRF